jgi:putative tryptophan/tyrosine transport system substrate-binding protein
VKQPLLLIIAAILALARPFPGHAAEVLVLQSSRLLPYEQARQGFEAIIAERPLMHGVKSIQAGDLRFIVLSEEPDQRRLESMIRREKPALLVVIGSNGLDLARKFPAIPIVYLLVPNPGVLIENHSGMTGVAMTMPPREQLRGFARVLPWSKRIGLIYDHARSGEMMIQARAAATELDIELIAERAASAKEVPALLAKLQGRIDAIWLLPDLTVLTPQTMEEILLFSFKNSIPVLSFSEKFLEAGAAVAVSYDPVAMGEKAGELAREVLQDPRRGKQPPALPDEVKITINHRSMKKINLDFNERAAVAPERPEKQP